MFALNLYEIALIIALYVHLVTMTSSIYVHRAVWHGSVNYHSTVEKTFRILLWLTVGTPNNFKTISHINHHQYTDKPGDPHSPHVFSFYNLGILRPIVAIVALIFFILPPPVTGGTKELLKKYKVVNRDDYTVAWPRVGRLIFLIANIILFGTSGVIIYVITQISLVFAQFIMLDIGGHVVGYRNTNTKDHSTNVMPIAIFGEELHNNHHADPSNPKFSVKWFEIDIGWAYIKLLCKMGLAEVKPKYL